MLMLSPMSLHGRASEGGGRQRRLAGAREQQSAKHGESRDERRGARRAPRRETSGERGTRSTLRLPATSGSVALPHCVSLCADAERASAAAAARSAATRIVTEKGAGASVGASATA